MAQTFRYTAHSEVGLVRKNNQDSAYASPAMIMVADGMGGAAAGDLASAVAVDALAATDSRLAEARADAAERRPAAAPALPEGPAGDVLAVLAATLDQANRRLNALVADDPSLDGMGTTVCGFVLVDDTQAALVNIGDSRAYLLRDGVLTRVSRDHSWVQTLVDEGRISEREALEHPHRSLILRVLNGKPQHEPEFTVVPVRSGDRLLVCSDGLCGLVTDAEIAAPAALADREAAVARLVDLAHEAGGYDNITIILADVDPADDQPARAEPPGVAILGAAAVPAIAARAAAQPAPPPDTLTPPDALPPDPVLSDATAVEATLVDLPALAPAPVAAAPAADPEEARYALRVGTRRQLLRAVLMVLVPALLLTGGAFGWYAYTQTRFYIGPTASGSTVKVALYQGVSGTVLGRPLSHVVDEGSSLGDLPPARVQQVNRTFEVSGLDAGRATLAELKTVAERCVAQREARARASQVPVAPSASPTPSMAPSGAPSGSPSGALGVPTAAPSTSVDTEEC